MNRILSLDVFRGLTIFLMILVNSQPSTAYPLLVHAQWNGCTLADLVFPGFLFIVGLTTVISLRNRGTSASLYQTIAWRSFNLFFIGLFLNFYPFTQELSHWRFYGTLQRIALCYFICALIYLKTTTKIQIALFTLIVLGYWLLMTQLPVPGFGANQLTPEGSWVSYFDQLLFSPSQLFETTYDPEGFLSTFPAIATTLLGVITGQLLLSNNSPTKKFYSMSGLGIALLILGWLWDFSFPINKNIWTSSFVLWTGGVSLVSYALCYLLIDICGYQKWSLPFKIFGMNALFIFVVHVILLKTQFSIAMTNSSGTLVNLRVGLVGSLTPPFSPPNAALLYGVLFITLNFLLVLFLYKRKIFIRI